MARGGHPVRGARPARGRRATPQRGGGAVEVVWHKHLALDTRKAMQDLGELVKREIMTEARGKGRAGDGHALPPLSPKYAHRKAKEGRAPAPDLYRSGHLWRSFRVLKLTDDEVWVGFNLGSGDEVRKFRRLKRQGRDPLSLSPSDLRRFAKDLVRRGLLKEEPGPPPRGRRPRAR